MVEAVAPKGTDPPLRAIVARKDTDEVAMRTLDDIMTQLRALLPELRRRYPIRSMGVFGSYVRGEQREDSDVDVLVELGDDMDLIAYAGLQIELSDALGVAVDLVEREALRPRLAPHVLSEVVPATESPCAIDVIAPLAHD